MTEPSGRTPTRTPPDQQASALGLSIEIARALDEARCEDILALDVRGLSQLTDFLVIASGTSERQIRTAIQKAEEAARARGEAAYGGKADGSSTWQVMDFVDVMVHVFEPSTRALYDLEMLWGDAPQVDWQKGRPAGEPGRARSRRR